MILSGFGGLAVGRGSEWGGGLSRIQGWRGSIGARGGSCEDSNGQVHKVGVGVYSFDGSVPFSSYSIALSRGFELYLILWLLEMRYSGSIGVLAVSNGKISNGRQCWQNQ